MHLAPELVGSERPVMASSMAGELGVFFFFFRAGRWGNPPAWGGAWKGLNTHGLGDTISPPFRGDR